MKPLCIFIFSLAMAVLAASAAFGSEVVLVKNGQFVEDYDKLAAQIEAGQILVMQVKRDQWIRFEVQQVIASVADDRGTMSVVIRTTDNRIARIPKTNHIRPVNFAQQFIAGAKQTKRLHGKQVVSVDLEQSFAPFVTFTEFLDMDYTLDQFTVAYDAAILLQKKIPEQLNVGGHMVDVASAMDGLDDFFRALATMGPNLDFGPRQVGFVQNRGWVWFDLFASFPVRTVYGGALITMYSDLPRHSYKRFAQIITSTRLALGWSPGECDAAEDLLEDEIDPVGF